MNNYCAQVASVHPREVVRPQLSVSRLGFVPCTRTTIRAATQPVRNTIIIRAPPPPQPLIIRAPPPPIPPTIIIHAPTQSAPRPAIVPPPPQPRVQALMPIHQLTMMRPSTTPPTAQPATIQRPPQAIIIRAPPTPAPSDELITFKLKWANFSVHGVLQDYMFKPHRPPQRDLLKFILAMEQVVREHLTAALVELHGLSFWVSVELTYTHQAKEIVDMKPQYLHSGKLVLTHIADLDQQIERMSTRP